MPNKKKKRKRKRKPDVRKIYKTTDGYFSGRRDIKKPRRVAVIDQRKDDGALAVVKIYSKRDKTGNAFLNKPVLDPKGHSSLKEPSIVGKQVHIGVREKGEYKAIMARDLRDTGDKLTRCEKAQIKSGVKGKTKASKKAYKVKMKKWRNHFKKK